MGHLLIAALVTVNLCTLNTLWAYEPVAAWASWTVTSITITAYMVRLAFPKNK